MFISSYLAYMGGELLDLSGAVAIFACAVVMAHYCFFSIGPPAQVGIFIYIYVYIFIFYYMFVCVPNFYFFKKNKKKGKKKNVFFFFQLCVFSVYLLHRFFLLEKEECLGACSFYIFRVEFFFIWRKYIYFLIIHFWNILRSSWEHLPFFLRRKKSKVSGNFSGSHPRKSMLSFSSIFLNISFSRV